MNISQYKKEDLEFISIKNDLGFEVIFCSLGASIFAIKDGNRYLTQTPVDLSTYKLTPIYHGKTIGRICNRVGYGEVIIGNKTYKMDLNEPHASLHGGREGLSTKIFSYEIKENNDEVKLIFNYLSKDLEEGLPGNVNLKVTYTLYNSKNEILLEYSASSDKDTVLALTNHTYFTLGSKNLNGLSLMINSDKFLHPNKEDLLPLEIRNVTPAMDFRISKKITKDINDNYLKNSRTYGYDHHYFFIESNQLIPQVKLSNNEYELNIYTNYSGVQIYTDNYPDNIKWKQLTDKRRRSIAIEPQDNTLNREILKAKDKYIRFIKYCFEKK